MVWLGGKWHVWYSRSTLSGIRYVDDGNTEYYSREGKIFQVVTALNEDNSAGAMEIGWLTDAEVWEGDRNEVIRLLESLIARLGNLATIPIENTLCLLDESRRHGIGGNNPTEADHQDRSSLVVQDATEAANMLLSQLRSGNPQLPEVRSSVGELDKAKHALDSFHHWLSEKRDLYATEFAKELGKRTADAITLVGLLNLIGGIVSTIGVIIVLIRHLGL
jgi:hypothetical protein